MKAPDLAPPQPEQHKPLMLRGTGEILAADVGLHWADTNPELEVLIDPELESRLDKELDQSAFSDSDDILMLFGEDATTVRTVLRIMHERNQAGQLDSEYVGYAEAAPTILGLPTHPASVIEHPALHPLHRKSSGEPTEPFTPADIVHQPKTVDPTETATEAATDPPDLKIGLTKVTLRSFGDLLTARNALLALSGDEAAAVNKPTRFTKTIDKVQTAISEVDLKHPAGQTFTLTDAWAIRKALNEAGERSGHQDFGKLEHLSAHFDNAARLIDEAKRH